jgi:antagonist of KipI
VSVVVVMRPGLLTTVQDEGRWGGQALGIPVAGAMDVYAHRLANHLVGNPNNCATLEITLIGPELLFEQPAVAAVTGAEFEVTLDGTPMPHGTTFRIEAGRRLRFGRRRLGARAYLAVGGGFDTPVVTAGFGGLEGRALRVGDRLPLDDAGHSADRQRRGEGLRRPDGRTVLRVMAGPQDDWFPAAVLDTLCRETFVVSPRSNRMGYRLEGPRLTPAVERAFISEPVPMGAIQVPPAGEPILLMADRQTAGGYPKVATVISADLWLAAQLAPGDPVAFRLCRREEAWSALVQRERQMLHVTDRGVLP